MKKNSLKKIYFLPLFIVLAIFIILPAIAADNIIQSVIISKSKNPDSTYELTINSSEKTQYKGYKKDNNTIYFDLKNSTLSNDAGTIYDDVSEIDSVIVKQIDKNKVRIYIQGNKASDTKLVFNAQNAEVNEAPTEKIILNRPINDYKSVDFEEDEDISQRWDDNSFNLSNLLNETLKSFQEGGYSIILVLIILVGIILAATKSIVSKIANEQTPLIGLKKANDNEFVPNIKADFKVSTENLTKKASAILKAQQELQKAQIKYQNYLNEKNKTTSNIPKTNPINTGFAINQYQKNEKNPYGNSEAIKIKRNYSSDVIKSTTNKIQTPPPYIKRKPTNSHNYTTNTQSQEKNLKFLESVSKIYERSGRKDLADGLKSSISRTKSL